MTFANRFAINVVLFRKFSSSSVTPHAFLLLTPAGGNHYSTFFSYRFAFSVNVIIQHVVLFLVSVT